MALKPDSATMVGLLTAAGVFLIYNNAVPTTANIRASVQHDADVEASRKKAAWESVALIAVVFAVARSVDSYIISGAALIGIDYIVKHENAINPNTQQVDTGTETMDASLHPLPDYSTAS